MRPFLFASAGRVPGRLVNRTHVTVRWITLSSSSLRVAWILDYLDVARTRARLRDRGSATSLGKRRDEDAASTPA